jgi:hypothetical protein
MHHPKASMCKSCKHKDHDCSKLDFKSMPVMDKYKQGGALIYVVRCVEFDKNA